MRSRLRIFEPATWNNQPVSLAVLLMTSARLVRTFARSVLRTMVRACTSSRHEAVRGVHNLALTAVLLEGSRVMQIKQAVCTVINADGHISIFSDAVGQTCVIAFETLQLLCSSCEKSGSELTKTKALHVREWKTSVQIAILASQLIVRCMRRIPGVFVDM